MRAMILAAGRGERLRPLTDRCPKPLIEVGGKPLILHHLENLAAAGVNTIVINLGWLGEQIRDRLGDGGGAGVDIQYSQEPPGALETAGGIIQALDRLGSEPFVVVSADVFTDYPLGRLVTRHPLGLAHLVLVDNPPHHSEGDFALSGQRLVNSGAPRLTYSGIGLFTPELFKGMSLGRRALRPVFDQAIEAGALSGEHYQGCWSDIGTPERLAAARRSSDSSR